MIRSLSRTVKGVAYISEMFPDSILKSKFSSFLVDDRITENGLMVMFE